MDKELVEKCRDAANRFAGKSVSKSLSEAIAQAIIPIVLERAAKASRNAITCGDYGVHDFEEIAASDSEKAIRNLGAPQ